MSGVRDRTCARCNWHPEDDETPEEHAEAAGHPLCITCSVSLPSDRPRVCRDCQEATAVQLDDIWSMWGELPDLLELQASRPLPGGDVLVLAGPGARGVQGADDPKVRGEIDDNRNADTPSVAWVLTSWADDWRNVRGEGYVERDAVASTAAAVVVSHDYLREHTPWAAEHHWAWAEFAADIRHLHAALLRVTRRHRGPTRLGMLCLLCRGQLVYRILDDGDVTAPSRDPKWWLAKNVYGPVDLAEWNLRVHGRAGLEDDQISCRDCGHVYDPHTLVSARAAAVEQLQWLDDDRGKWGTVRAFADNIGIPFRTLQAWARDGVVASSQHGGTTYLLFSDVERECAAYDAAQWFDDDKGDRWGTVRAVAAHTDRSPWSLRTWERSGYIRSIEKEGQMYLHLADVQSEAELRAPRRRIGRPA